MNDSQLKRQVSKSRVLFVMQYSTVYNCCISWLALTCSKFSIMGCQNKINVITKYFSNKIDG